MELTTRALIDNGSQVNLITKKIVDELGMEPNPEKTTFAGIGGHNLGSSIGEIELTIKLKEGNFIKNKFYVVKHIKNYWPGKIVNKWNSIKNLLADDQYNKPGKIDALLGVGIWIKIIEPKILKNNQSIAHKTK